MSMTSISISGFIFESSKATGFSFCIYLCLGGESAFMSPNFKMYSNFAQDLFLRDPQIFLSCKIFIINVTVRCQARSTEIPLEKDLRRNSLP